MEQVWSPSSWKSKPLAQEVTYPDTEALAAALAELSALPPLVTSWEVERLKAECAEAAEGRRFVLQGGDCAERLEDCRSESIVARLKVLLKMSILILYGASKPVTRVGRFAGQYAKPRSSDTETRDGVTLPAYRGQLFNKSDFTLEARTPDPTLLLQAYRQSALTLNFIRSLVEGGFANLHHQEIWEMGYLDQAQLPEEVRAIAGSVQKSVRFMETLLGHPLTELERVNFYTGHEGLNLDYEMAQTRHVPRREGWYDLTTHFPWIGERTRQLDGAHVEFFRGIANPVGVNVGPNLTGEEAVALCRTLNPRNEPGKLTLIHRMGADRVAASLPPLVEAVTRAGCRVLWVCDPMHGNTTPTASGRKTRSFSAILRELEQAFELHARMGTVLGGVHLELTGDHVTECVGGAWGLSEADLEQAYETDVDPRLNYQQSVELALRIAHKMGG